MTEQENRKNTQMWLTGIIPIIPWVLLHTLVLLGRIKRRNITATKQMVCVTRLDTLEIRAKQHIQPFCLDRRAILACLTY